MSESHTQLMTRRQLRAVLYNIALVYLEVERGLRQRRQLAALLTKDEYRRHRLTTPGRAATTKPVRPHDIGRVRIEQTTPGLINANVLVRRDEDTWSTLLVDLRSTGRGWQVERLERLERLLPREPREVELDEHAFEQRVRLVEDERRLVAAAHQAVDRRYDQVDDKRTRAGRELRRQRDAWSTLRETVEAEAETLADRERLAHHHDGATSRSPRPAALAERTTCLEPVLGPRPDGTASAEIWDAAMETVEGYLDRWCLTDERELLRAAEASDQEAERRQLLKRLGASVRALEPPQVSSRTLDRSDPTIDTPEL